MEREQLGEASPALSSPQSSLPQRQQQQPAPQVQQRPVVRPRHAPTYSVVNAIIEEEDGPGPSCGHTLTAVGEEGTPGYVGPRLILFGGATALEGNSSASGTPSSAGSAGIRVLLDDLLVAEDLAAAQTTSVASHAAAYTHTCMYGSVL